MDTKTKQAIRVTAKYLETLNQSAFADAVKRAEQDGSHELAGILRALIDVSEACEG